MTKPSLRRVQSLKVHRDHFETIIKDSLEELKGAFEGVVVEIIVKDLSYGRDLALEMVLTSFASDLQRSVDRFSHDNLESTWSTFDKNKDGSLQKSEMRNVVKSLLKEIDNNLPQMVQSAAEPAAENLEHWISSDSYGALGFHKDGSGADIVLHANVQARISKAATKLSTLLSVLMQGLLKDSDAISDELFDTIDENKDGKVTKREYSKGFAKAFGTVVDFSKITKLVLQQRQGPSSKQLSKSDEQLSTVGAGLVVIAVAAAAFFVWKRSSS